MIDFQDVCGLLDSQEMRYAADEDRRIIHLAFRGVIIQIRVSRKGEALGVFAPRLLMLDEANGHEREVLYHMAVLNGGLRLAKLALDPSDLEIDAHCEVAVADGTLTAAQLALVLRDVVRAAERLGPVLRYVAARGDDGLSTSDLVKRVLRQRRSVIERERRRCQEESARDVPPKRLRSLFAHLEGSLQELDEPPGDALCDGEGDGPAESPARLIEPEATDGEGATE